MLIIWRRRAHDGSATALRLKKELTDSTNCKKLAKENQLTANIANPK